MKVYLIIKNGDRYMKTESGVIISKDSPAKGIYDLWVSCPAIAAVAKPGQFVDIRCEGYTLRRPISICKIDRDKAIRLVFVVKGGGTEWLAARREGETLDLLGPLGNGFDVSAPGSAVFVGGGIGVPPMLEAADATIKNGGKATVILGFRSADAVILTEDFKNCGCEVRLATDDGSAGHHGFVTGLLKERLLESPCSAVYACGPRPMLKAVAELSEKMGASTGIPCFVSMEERMACGVGACLGCACKVKENGREHYQHVCKNGPVFDSRKVVW